MPDALSSVALVAPEREAISAYLRTKERWADTLGLSFSLHTTWDGFSDAFRTLGGQDAFGGFSDPSTGFWIEVTKDGRQIATYASYLIPMVEADLREHVERHGWYQGATDRWTFSGEATELAEHIVGAVMFNGGIAVHPDHRSGGDGLAAKLAPVLAEIGRVLGYGLHMTDGSVYMAKPAIGSVMEKTEMTRQVSGVDWFRDSQKFGPRRVLGWTSTEAALHRAGLRTSPSRS